MKFFESMSKYKTYIIIIVIILSSGISIFMQSKDDNVVINDEKIENVKDKIAVYIAGEVENPGVYYIDEGLRLNDLISICGGFTEEADISDINLAEKLNDSDMINIPKNIKLDKSDDVDEYYEESNKNGLININKASIEELKTLDGIGDTLADNIINYRKRSKFTSIEQLLDVDGIGKSKYDKIKDKVCI